MRDRLLSAGVRELTSSWTRAGISPLVSGVASLLFAAVLSPDSSVPLLACLALRRLLRLLLALVTVRFLFFVPVAVLPEVRFFPHGMLKTSKL